MGLTKGRFELAHFVSTRSSSSLLFWAIAVSAAPWMLNLASQCFRFPYFTCKWKNIFFNLVTNFIISHDVLPLFFLAELFDRTFRPKRINIPSEVLIATSPWRVRKQKLVRMKTQRNSKKKGIIPLLAFFFCVQFTYKCRHNRGIIHAWPQKHVKVTGNNSLWNGIEDVYNFAIPLSLWWKERQRGKFRQWTSGKLVLSRPEVVIQVACDARWKNYLYVHVNLAALTHRTKPPQVSKVIFTNSLNSDCKVNLVVHCRDVSILDICSLGANFLERESNATTMEWLAIVKVVWWYKKNLIEFWLYCMLAFGFEQIEDDVHVRKS